MDLSLSPENGYWSWWNGPHSLGRTFAYEVGAKLGSLPIGADCRSDVEDLSGVRSWWVGSVRLRTRYLCYTLSGTNNNKIQ